MAVAATSAEALYRLEAAGKTHGRKATILRVVVASPCAMSRSHIAKVTGLSVATVCGRVNELIHRDKVLEETEQRIVCPVTLERVRGVIPVTSREQRELFTDAA